MLRAYGCVLLGRMEQAAGYRVLNASHLWLFLLRPFILADQFRRQRRPSCLVAGAKPFPGIAVKIFIEQYQAIIAGLLVKPVVFAKKPPVARLILLK